MSGIQKKIGGKITEIRLLKKLTQAQFAEKMNLSVESISRMERGVTFPSLKTMEKAANALEVSLKDFFDFDEHTAKDKGYERELSKLIAFLRTTNKNEIILIHKILKVAFRKLKQTS